MTKEDEFEWLRKRLDAIIQLLLENGDGAAQSVSDKIGRLLDMGFTQVETAKVIGKPPNYVSAVAANRRKKGARNKNAKTKKRPDGIEHIVAASTGDAT